MKHYYEIKKDSSFYKDYLLYMQNSQEFNKATLDFLKSFGLESTTFIARKKELYILPNAYDITTFGNQMTKELLRDDYKKFKRTSEIGKAWTKFARDSVVPIRPKILFDIESLNDIIGRYVENISVYQDGIVASIYCNNEITIPNYLIQISEEEYKLKTNAA